MGAYPPPYGGVQTNLVAIRRYLLEREIPCAVINLTRHRQSRAEQLYHPESALQLIRLLMSLRYDIIHLHHGGDLTLRLLALYLLCSLLPGKRAVLTFHSGEDRRVKRAFREGVREGVYSATNKEVIRAGPEERRANPRSTSAKLRWAIRA